MKYLVYKLNFKEPVHFGKNDLSDSDYSLCSDTFFSALCLEAISVGSDSLNLLVDKMRRGLIKFSDGFPFIEDILMLPKPYVLIQRESSGSSIERKAYKSLKYIPMNDLDIFLRGEYDVLSAVSMDRLGIESVKVSASVRNDENETKPYEVGIYTFNKNCGLFFIIGCEEASDLSFIDQLIRQLSYSGLGGRRSSGYGRFDFETKEIDPWLEERLSNASGKVMLINTALPGDDELEKAISNASYSLIKRSGFVNSADYSDSWQRKKDLFMFKSGSCFDTKFSGDVYDVSTDKGNHPVYRCGKPFFMRVTE